MSISLSAEKNIFLEDFLTREREVINKIKTSEDVTEEWKEHLSQEYNIELKMGISKAAFIPKDYDFVVKIPFRGWTSCETGQLYVNTEAGMKQDHWDYCKAEVELYRAAELEGIGDFFVPLIYFTTIGETPVYLQSKWKIVYEYLDYALENRILEKVEESGYEQQPSVIETLSSNESGALYLLERVHGKEKLLKLCDFIKKHSLNDINLENVGFRTFKHGETKIKILDYAGYREG